MEAPSPQSRDTVLNETVWELPCVCDRNIERVAPVIVALVGMEARLNAINPRRKRLVPVLPSKK